LCGRLCRSSIWPQPTAYSPRRFCLDGGWSAFIFWQVSSLCHLCIWEIYHVCLTSNDPL
jgi:hypothetical protein